MPILCRVASHTKYWQVEKLRRHTVTAGALVRLQQQQISTLKEEVDRLGGNTGQI